MVKKYPKIRKQMKKRSKKLGRVIFKNKGNGKKIAKRLKKVIA